MTDTMTDERALEELKAWLFVMQRPLYDYIASRLSALQAQQPVELVAWSIELADGTVAEIGWMDMRLFEAAKAIGTLAKGARYIFAYRIMEQPNDKA